MITGLPNGNTQDPKRRLLSRKAVVSVALREGEIWGKRNKKRIREKCGISSSIKENSEGERVEESWVNPGPHLLFLTQGPLVTETSGE